MVDAYRRPSRQRNTAGRYRVGAKTEKEAISLVREAIGFGSVEFLCWDNNSDRRKVGYKEVVKEIPHNQLANGACTYEQPRHACDPLNESEIEI